MRAKEVFAAAALILLILIPASCGRHYWGFLADPSPWGEYENKLQATGMDQSLAGKRWTQVASESISNPLRLQVPFQIQGVFKSRSIQAFAYIVELKKGGAVRLEVDWEPVDSSLLFIDVFQVQKDLSHINSLASCEDFCRWEIPATGSYIIRVQPELLAEGNFRLSLLEEPSYSIFPVEGMDAQAIKSPFGVSREGGIRTHEGVDIFADKGTAVVSPVRGLVTSVKEGGRGGKVVWVSDLKRGYDLYFAHLDTQLVRFGQWVSPGQIIGTVGNTGNAKYTPSHLHFGMYEHQPFDPFPSIDNRLISPDSSSLTLDEEVLRVKGTRANVRTGPSTSFPVSSILTKDEVVFAEAVTANWYQVTSASGVKGFMHHSVVEEAYPAPTALQSEFVLTSAFTGLVDTLFVDIGDFRIIGRYNSYSVLADQDYNVYYLKN